MKQISLYDQLQVLEPKEALLSKQERLRAINRPLLSWYETNARTLPWREDPRPYRVWISEIMLQQTRVEAVKPYFERFIKELPTIKALATVEEDRLLKLWEGLGYYNRARNLKKAALMAINEFQGELPENYDLLLTLPGIGSYTAGAIASIAYNIPVPAVDGNVLRVISRLLASSEDILKQSVKRQMEIDLKESMPKNHARDFNQALIEIGAMVCIPNGQPKCSECPLSSLCLARKQDLISHIPVKTSKKARRVEVKTVLLMEHKDTIALHKRADCGLLASLYEFPNLEGHLTSLGVLTALGLTDDAIISMEELPKATHIFSHIEWHMVGYRLILKESIPNDYLSVTKTALKQNYPIPNAFSTYMRLVK